MRKIALVVIGVLLLCGQVRAEGKVKTITLKDGTAVQGEITGVDNGRYVIQSPSLGEIRVKEDDVVSMVSGGLATPAGSSAVPSTEGQMQQVQSRIMADPQAMADIQALAADPDVLRLISDPAFMDAAKRHDFAALQDNPATAALMANPKVKAVIEKLNAAR